LSCSCVSGVVFSLLDLFLGVGFAGLGRPGEEDFFFRFWERGGGVGFVADLEECRYCEGGL